MTPNAHALASRFGDLDNFYDEGTLSADGHNWIVQAEANDYVEKEFGAFYRSYPSQGGDALAYQRDGFLWNAAEKAGVSVQNFGEYIFNPYNLPSNAPDWSTWYAQSQWMQDGHQGPEPISEPCQYTRVQSDIPSLQAISAPCFPNFQLTIPDQYRVDQWLPVLPARGEDRPDAAADVHVADDRPHHGLGNFPTRSPRSLTTTWPSAASSTRSHTASSGRTRRSSSTRTTPRTVSTMSTDTARRLW